MVSKHAVSRTVVVGTVMLVAACQDAAPPVTAPEMAPSFEVTAEGQDRKSVV